MLPESGHNVQPAMVTDEAPKSNARTKVKGVTITLKSGSEIILFSEYQDLADVVRENVHVVARTIRAPLDLLLIRDWAYANGLKWIWKVKLHRNPVLYYKSRLDVIARLILG